jgi:hypothetical protein
MKNLKKLSRKQLKTVSGGDTGDRYANDASCHCHGCGPSVGEPNGLPPADYYQPNSPQECWKACDDYRENC